MKANVRLRLFPDARAIRATMRTAWAIFMLIAPLLASCSNEETVLSARTSPSGSMVAENVLVDAARPANGGTSHLVIRNAHAKHSYNAELSESAPDLFLRWIDESHLEVWREGALCDSPMPKTMGEVHILCRPYVFPPNSADIYRAPGISAAEIVVPASNVSVLFDQRPTKNGRSCILSIETEQNDPTLDATRVEIVVGVTNSCKGDGGRSCAGLSTRFRLSNRQNLVPQTVLTSASIADIPSYNRIPEGGEGTMIRGQFLEQNALALIEHLKEPSIQIEYSRDFFGQVLKYEVPLTGHAKALDQFDACVGDADLLWTQHRG